MPSLQKSTRESAKAKNTHTNAETCQADGFQIEHGLVAVALEMYYIKIRQWQYIGSNFSSNDPLHLFSQRHGMSCPSLSSRPCIPMGLV